jgi:CRISPR/Cas system-associated exonuclease Cas4 (RecB family)
MTSNYPQIWGTRGYPERLVQSTIIGRIIHRAVETITKEFHRRGCMSFDDAQAITAMRELGGFSRVIEKSLDEILSQYADNPRVSGTLEDARRNLLGKKGEIREDVKILYSRMFGGRRTASRDSFQGQGTNGELGVGIHPEVRLVNDEMKWEGVADLIHLAPNECEIREIKTGIPSEEHAEQLRIYSLLWLLDPRKNPSRRPVSKLTISYIQEDFDVRPLSSVEYGAYRKVLLERTNEAYKAVARRPPEAISSIERCGDCSVRHLCSVYWDRSTLKMLAKDKRATSTEDIEVEIFGIHGPRSYDAVIVASRFLPANAPFVLRLTVSSTDYKKGDRVRLTGVRVVGGKDDEGDDRMIISASKITEMYLLQL